jgi:glycosidase
MNEVKKLVSLRRTQDALINGGLRWVKAENDYVVYLRESKKQSILVLVSRGAIDATIDLSEYGYSISKTLYGEKVQGQSFRITSEGAIQGIWIVTR